MPTPPAIAVVAGPLYVSTGHLPDPERSRRWWPRLTRASRSTPRQLVAKFLAQRLGLDLFASKPEV